MNMSFYLTTLATVTTLVILSFIFIPFYIVFYSAALKERVKTQLEFLHSVQKLENKTMLDNAIERMFEEGAME